MRVTEEKTLVHAIGQVTGQVEKWLLDVLKACIAPKKSSEIQALTSIKHRETFKGTTLIHANIRAARIMARTSA